MGPRDYLDQFLKLLAVLRNGDTRFLPLLLSKVHDVLPTLASPLLQSPPENAPNLNCAEIDIFEGFPPMMNLGGPPAPMSNTYGISNSSVQEFKYSNAPDFKVENQGLPFDRRIEDLSPPSLGQENSANSPFLASPSVMTSSSPMEYPNINHDQYASFQDPNSHAINNNSNMMPTFGDGGGSQPGYKREFEMNVGLLQNTAPMNGRRPPLRPNSSSSFNIQQQQQHSQHQIPRSIPEFGHLQRVNSHGEHGEMGVGGVNDMQFR